MSPSTINDCCCEEYKAAYESMEAAALAADEVDVAMEAVDIYQAKAEIQKLIKEHGDSLASFKAANQLAVAYGKAITGNLQGAAFDAAKIALDKLGDAILEDYEASRLGDIEARELRNLAKNYRNKLNILDAALKKCRKLFENLLKCTAKYEPKTISLDLTWSEDNSVYYIGEGWLGGVDFRIGHKKVSCKRQAQLERKTPSLTDAFGPWFQYFRKSPKIGEVRDLVCTYEGEAQANIIVDKAEPFIAPTIDAHGFPMPRFHDFKTELECGTVTAHFYISWSRFRPCEPLKYNIIFDGNEKLYITCYVESTCFSRIDDLVMEANVDIKYIEGLSPIASYEWLGTLISDPRCRYPHKWTRRAEKEDSCGSGDARKYILEINVESR